MALAVVVPNHTILHARFYCTMQSQVSVNNIFYDVDGGGGAVAATDQDTICGILDNLANDNYPALLSELAKYHRMSVQDLIYNGVDAWRYEHLENFHTIRNTDGLVTGEALPKQVAGLIQKRTGFSGLGGRGRIYLPFPGEDSNFGNATPSAAYTVDLQDFADALLHPTAITIPGTTYTLYPIVFCAARGGYTFQRRLSGATASFRWATCRKRGDFGRVNSLPGA